MKRDEFQEATNGKYYGSDNDLIERCYNYVLSKYSRTSVCRRPSSGPNREVVFVWSFSGLFMEILDCERWPDLHIELGVLRVLRW